MEQWRSATREQERRLWGTLAWVGGVLTLVLASSIAVAAGDTDLPPSPWFFVQQGILFVLSAAGTAVALRRRRSFRTGRLPL